MIDRFEMVRGTLGAMDFSSARVDAAIAALKGGNEERATREEVLLAPKQLCGRLGISLTTLWRMQPPFIKVGARKRFSWNEVQEFLSKGKVAA